MKVEKRIQKAFEKLAEELRSTVPNINYGGCCVFASYAADALQKVAPEGINVQIRVTKSEHADPDMDSWSIDEMVEAMEQEDLNPRVLRDWNRMDVYLHHVWVHIRGKNINFCADGEGVYDPSEVDDRWGKSYDGSLPFDVALELSQSNGWNQKFNRKYVPTIKALVDEHIGPLKEIIG